MNVQAVADLAVRGTPQKAGPSPETRPPMELVRAPAPVESDGSGEPSADEVAKALEGVNGFLAANDSHIQFAMHEKAKRMMVEVIDNQTREVIKTFPPKELLDLAARIGELVGTLLDKKG